MSETEGKYTVELFKEVGEGAGQEEIIVRHDNLTVARANYRGRVFPNIRAGWSSVRSRSRSGKKRSTRNDAVKCCLLTNGVIRRSNYRDVTFAG